MAPERWVLLESWFEQALAAPNEGARKQLIAHFASIDTALAMEVQALLTAADESSQFLSRGEIHTDFPPTNLPKEIGSYQIERLLGWGGMGIVYLAEADGMLEGRRVAIKVARTSTLPDDDLTGYLLSEVRALSQLQHPHIAHLYDADRTPLGQFYFVMEYIPGVPFSTYMRETQPSLDERLRLFQQLLDAVHYAHQKAVIHRDLKPSNVLVIAVDGESPYVKLLDFGLSVLAKHTDATSTLRRQTPGYVAPEVLNGEASTVASDVYALGIVLYEILAGARPTETERVKQRMPSQMAMDRVAKAPRAERHMLRRRARNLSGDLDAIVMRAISPEPESRYPSVAALREDLRRYTSGLPLVDAPLRVLAWTRRAWRSTQHVRGYIAIGLIVALCATVFRLTYGPLDRQVVEVTGKGRILTFRNATGQIVHTVTRAGRRHLQSGGHPFGTFGDLDGDGRNEVFWIDPNNDPNLPATLTAYSIANNNVLWEHEVLAPEVTYPNHSEDFLSTYYHPEQVIARVNADGQCYLYLRAWHPSLFVGLIRMLDCATGSTQQEFVNAGRLQKHNFMPVGPMQETMLVVGGGSNALDAALLYVFHPDDIAGQGVYIRPPLRPNDSHTFTHYYEEQRLYAPFVTVLRFEPSHISRRTRHADPSVQNIGDMTTSDGVELQITDGYDDRYKEQAYQTPIVSVELSPALAPTKAFTNDAHDLLTEHLYAEGILDAIPNVSFREDFLANIRYYVPETGAWVPYATWSGEHAWWLNENGQFSNTTTLDSIRRAEVDP